MSDGGRPRVLIVDDNARARTLVRLGLELEGLEVVEAGSLAEGRSLLGADFDGYVLDRQLPDGDGLTLVPHVRSQAGPAPVIIYSTLDATDEPAGVTHVDKGDLPGVIEALGLSGGEISLEPLRAVGILRDETDAIAEDWKVLCLWDPELPPDAEPPLAAPIVSAVANALGRPQPLGWGVDPVMEHAIAEFAVAVESVEIAVGELICLGEAINRRLADRIPPAEAEETTARLHMIVERAMGAAARQAVARLQEEAYVDPLTGLLNRRAFERDVERESSRALRHRRRYTIVLIDLDGLKRINDQHGHTAGDLTLRELGTALASATRAGDAAYRVGGDEFILLLTDVAGRSADIVVSRVKEMNPPAFSWGAALFPDDGTDLEDILDIADRELRKRKGHSRR
jgi:diguanylate cyclase (GGDEF)-like protein